MDDLRERLVEKMDEYLEMFDSCFPTIPLLEEGEEQCIEMINQCLASKKNVAEMGFYIPGGWDAGILY